MNRFVADRLCLLCSYRTIEDQQFGNVRDGISNTRTYQATNAGLVCTICNGFVCIDCIRLLVPVISKESRKHSNTDILDMYKAAIDMHPGSIKTPPGYIGHCCSIDKPAQSSQDIINHPHETKEIHSTNESRLSGCIFYPEFCLFIDSPINCIDIHAVGAECNVTRTISKKRKHSRKGVSQIKKTSNIYLPARWHCVISHSFATSNNRVAPTFNGSYPKSWRIKYFRNLKISCPHNPMKVAKVRTEQ